MQVMYERCAGIDVHKKTVVVCVLLTQADGTVQKQIRTFATMTADLLALDEWLRSLHIEHLALESTGVYWLCWLLGISVREKNPLGMI
jgi:transposase